MKYKIENENLVQPDIYIGNFRIAEPVTMITDLLVTAVCIYAFLKLAKFRQKGKLYVYLRFYFLSMGIATALGGILGHSLHYMLSFEWKLPGWFVSMVSVALLERAVIEYTRKVINRKLGIFFSWLNIIELTTFMFLAFFTLNFFVVIYHSTYGLLIVVGGFSSYMYYATRSKGSKLFLYAVAVSGMSGMFFLQEWGIGKWFNHLDISHVGMAIACYIFYLGSREILKQKDPIPAT
jgi:hypothetical protein